MLLKRKEVGGEEQDSGFRIRDSGTTRADTGWQTVGGRWQVGKKNRSRVSGVW
jgi:hypothetical protein